MAAIDFRDMAARMSASVTGVRACLILSRDGLSLGAHPADGEVRAREAWDALQKIGDPQRGFLDMGTEIWVMSCTGAYAAVVVADSGSKAGVLLDLMDSQLLAAEHSRATDMPSPQPRPQTVKATAGASASGTERIVDLSASVGTGVMPSAAPAPMAAVEKTVEKKSGNVDRVALAREFGRLFDNEPAGDV